MLNCNCMLLCYHGIVCVFVYCLSEGFSVNQEGLWWELNIPICTTCTKCDSVTLT